MAYSYTLKLAFSYFWLLTINTAILYSLSTNSSYIIISNGVFKVKSLILNSSFGFIGGIDELLIYESPGPAAWTGRWAYWDSGLRNGC